MSAQLKLCASVYYVAAWPIFTAIREQGMHCIVFVFIVFIHLYSASHSLSLSEALPTTAIDTVSVDNVTAFKRKLGKLGY